jgi:hypothetical protein
MMHHLKKEWKSYTKWFLIVGGSVGVCVLLGALLMRILSLILQLIIPSQAEFQAMENQQNCVNRLNEAIYSPTLALAQNRTRKGKDECQKVKNSEVLVKNLEAIANKSNLAEVKYDLKEQLKANFSL